MFNISSKLLNWIFILFFSIFSEDSSQFLLNTINLEIYSSLGSLQFKEPIKNIEKIQIGNDINNCISIYDQRSKENKKKNPTSVSVIFKEIDNNEVLKKKIKKSLSTKTYDVIVQTTTKLQILYDPETEKIIEKFSNSKSQTKFVKRNIGYTIDYRNLYEKKLKKRYIKEPEEFIKIEGNRYKYEKYNFGYTIDFKKPVKDSEFKKFYENKFQEKNKKKFDTEYKIIIHNKKNKKNFLKFGRKYDTIIYKSKE